MSRIALIAGSTGIVGQNLAARLVAEGWTVYGLARHPRHDMAGVLPIAADLLDLQNLKSALKTLTPTHVFFCSWLRQETEAENCRVNSAMVRNVFEALPAPEKLEHAALTTGMKHYLGPFEAYASGKPPQTPFREEMPRLPLANFYYDQEDVLYAAAEKYGFSWSVHRPHTIIGYAVGNAMNMGSTLAVYATICRETGRPFVFPGSDVQWNSLTDLTDARQLARQLLWASTSEGGRNEAFNVVNGDVFRWKWLWPRLAAWFGLEAAPYPGHETPLEGTLSQDRDLWKQISTKYGLVESQIERLASAWHTDADLGRPVECVTDLSKSRLAGFDGWQYTPDSFFDLFARLRAEKLIP